MRAVGPKRARCAAKEYGIRGLYESLGRVQLVEHLQCFLDESASLH
jgi:hypothetical protein